MLTPWFAVSVGIVTATSLTLATPHPALTFPAPKSGRCVEAGCTGAVPPDKGRHQTIKHEIPLPSQPDASEQPAGIRVEYAMQPMKHDRFIAVIVIASRHPLKNWTLKFVLRGVHIDSIIWAKWRLDGPDGVIVNGSPSPWPRSSANEARIVIDGSGAPSWPRGCVFDTGSCRFRALTGETPRPGRWPFGR